MALVLLKKYLEKEGSRFRVQGTQGKVQEQEIVGFIGQGLGV